MGLYWGKFPDCSAIEHGDARMRWVHGLSIHVRDLPVPCKVTFPTTVCANTLHRGTVETRLHPNAFVVSVHSWVGTVIPDAVKYTVKPLCAPSSRLITGPRLEVGTAAARTSRRNMNTYISPIIQKVSIWKAIGERSSGEHARC